MERTEEQTLDMLAGCIVDEWFFRHDFDTYCRLIDKEEKAKINGILDEIPALERAEARKADARARLSKMDKGWKAAS